MNRFIFLALLVLLSGCAYTQQQTAEPLDDKAAIATVFQAKKIITMNPSQPEVGAVAVSGGKIVGLGDADKLARDLAGYRVVQDARFADRVLMPGFIDNHLHPTLAGILLPSVFITPFDWNLPGQQVKGVQGQAAYLQRLIEVERSHPAEQTLITWGYHQYFHGALSRSDLDAVSPTRPIIVWQRSFHEIIMNSAALQLLGIDRASVTGIPNIDLDKGHFWETGLFAIFPKLAPLVLNPQRLKQGIKASLLHAQSNGITTVADQGAPLFDLDMESALLTQSLIELQAPLNMMVIGSAKSLSQNGFAAALQIIEQLPSRDSAQIKFLPKQVKLLADGAFYSQLMQMQDGYLDGHHGEWIMPPEELAEAARLFWNNDYQLHIHVNGDLGVKVVLDLIETLQAENPRPAHNTVLHHYGYSAPDQAERVAKLGVLVSANPYYLYALGEKYAEIGLGKQRAEHISRLGDLERNGVPISFHSDLPMAPAAPLLLASTAASRLSAAGNVLAPNERVSINTALRGITIEAAAAIGQQDEIGSIELGKYADFTVLGADPRSVSAAQLRDIQVLGTVLRGEFFRQPIESSN